VYLPEMWGLTLHWLDTHLKPGSGR
jgi:hypothetical protein